MEVKLTKLYNTLLMIKTEGESTKIMADCLRYLEGMISEQKSVPAAESSEA